MTEPKTPRLTTQAASLLPLGPQLRSSRCFDDGPALRNQDVGTFPVEVLDLWRCFRVSSCSFTLRFDPTQKSLLTRGRSRSCPCLDCSDIISTVRIQAKTRELRERQARERDYAEILDVSRSPDRAREEEPPHVGFNALNSSLDSGHSRPHSPRDDYPHLSPLHQHQHQHSDSLYPHKGRNERPPSADRWVGVMGGGGRAG
ncbi:hypothetical protein D4764_15G0004270 [Takifugu flavidus]|uniref:Uncharacterized protein n=1 Tax=Takifugu flavidus TaxID=433684 RepID=A0A5C6P0J0_9TELE|nr:hypothetical protein D4764_15G0004270 [Takifugu flavidus]